MKKVRHFVILFIGTLLTSTAFSYVSGKKTINETLTYCPSQIICSESENLKSCKFDGGNPVYWSHMWINDKADVVVGTYKFIVASSTYRSKSAGVSCTYKNDSSGSEKRISLYAEYQTNLEAFYSNATSWVLKYYPSVTTATCFADTPQACLIHDQSGFVIVNDYVVWSVLPYVNDRPIYNPHDGNVSVVRYEDALTRCESEKICKIDIMAIESSKDRSQIKIGSLIVDMDDKLKIKRVDVFKSSRYEIKKIDPFNSIEVKKIDSPLPVDSSIAVNNHINSEILVSVNDINIIDKAIAVANKGSVFLDRVIAGCQSAKKCKIDFKTVNGAFLGSMVVDVEDKMTIIQVTSLRSSEILVSQIDSNAIEIAYPNKR